MAASLVRPGGDRRRFAHVVYRNARVYRRSFLVVFSGFFEPVFYLFSLGVGLGELVGEIDVGGRSVPYREFVAPALLATSAMNGAIFESTVNVFFKLRFAKVYDAMLATPLGVRDVAIGELAWCVIRGALYAVGFLAVMAAFGLVSSWWALMALPAGVLVAFAFASAGLAFTSYMRNWTDFDIVLLVELPLFLLSATFFPLSSYPEGVQWLVRATPLYQGVELCRSFVIGDVGLDVVGHAAYLAAMGAACLAVATRKLGRVLQP